MVNWCASAYDQISRSGECSHSKSETCLKAGKYAFTVSGSKTKRLLSNNSFTGSVIFRRQSLECVSRQWQRHEKALRCRLRTALTFFVNNTESRGEQEELQFHGFSISALAGDKACRGNPFTKSHIGKTNSNKPTGRNRNGPPFGNAKMSNKILTNNIG